MNAYESAQRAYDQQEPDENDQLECEVTLSEELVNWLEAQPPSILLEFSDLFIDELHLESIDQLEHWIRQGEIS